MYHNFFIHSCIDGHLGCFHVLAIVNSAATDIGVHVSFSMNWHIFLTGRIPAKESRWIYPHWVGQMSVTLSANWLTIRYHFGATVLKLGAWQVEGRNVVYSFCILTAVVLEDSELNLLPRIEKWHLSSKTVNI